MESPSVLINEHHWRTKGSKLGLWIWHLLKIFNSSLFHTKPDCILSWFHRLLRVLYLQVIVMG